MRNFFAIMFLCLAAISSQVRACEIDDCLTSYDAYDQSNSMTVTADQILLTENAMFVHIDHALIPIKSICLEDGLYNCLLLDVHLCFGMCTWCNTICSIGAQKCSYINCDSNRYPDRCKFRYQLMH